MNVKVLKKLLKAQEVQIKGLEQENQSLKQQLQKITKLPKTTSNSITKKRRSRAERAQIKSLRATRIKQNTQRARIRRKQKITQKIETAVGPFSAWPRSKGYHKSAISSLNRVYRKHPEIKQLAEELLTLISHAAILDMVYTVYTQFHTAEENEQIYLEDPDWVDPEIIDDLIDSFKETIIAKRQYQTGWRPSFS